MDSHESPLLTDQQLRDASSDQLEDLAQRVSLAMQERGLPGLVWLQSSDTIPGEPGPGESLERPASD